MVAMTLQPSVRGPKAASCALNSLFSSGRGILSTMMPASPLAKTAMSEPTITATSWVESTDEQLIEAYLDGHRAAFEALMNRYSAELLHFLIRFVGSRAAAEDVFQEAFLQVHQSAESFDLTRRFKPWLFTIAANKGRDHHRKHGKHKGVSLSASMGRDDEGRPFVDLLESDLPTPDLPLESQELQVQVKTAVDELPAHLREILLLSYFQRMSYNQIAESLEIPLGTVKSRLHTAVATFASTWKALHEDDKDGGEE